jgi:hypothetical protein
MSATNAYDAISVLPDVLTFLLAYSEEKLKINGDKSSP